MAGEDNVQDKDLPQPQAAKKKKKKSKKQFVPLPTLERLEDSLPFSIHFTQKMGRHAVATKDLKPGDLVLREMPVAQVVRPQYREEVCHGCLSALPSTPSTNASSHFCSKACGIGNANREDLQDVHAQVPHIAEEADVDETLLRFIVELDALRAAGEAPDAATTKDVRELKGQPPLVRCGIADVEALASFWEQQELSWRKVVSAACRQLHAALAATGAFEPSPVRKLQDLAAIVSMNSHGLAAGNEANTDQAVGLFPALSMFNHSCRPNACFAARGQEMQVRAVREVKAGDQLFVTYINLTEDRSTRQMQLLATKHFTCACERCSQPLELSPDRFLEGLTCPGHACPGPTVNSSRDPAKPLSGQEWTCCSCGKKTSDSGRDALVSQLRAEWQRAMLLPRGRVEAVKEAKQAFEGVLAASPAKVHPLHTVMIDCLMPLVNLCRAQGDVQAALQYLTRLTSALANVVGLPTTEQGNLLQLQSRLLEQRGQQAPPALAARIVKQAREAMSSAIEMYKVTLGDDHPLVATANARLKQLR